MNHFIDEREKRIHPKRIHPKRGWTDARLRGGGGGVCVSGSYGEWFAVVYSAHNHAVVVVVLLLVLVLLPVPLSGS